MFNTLRFHRGFLRANCLLGEAGFTGFFFILPVDLEAADFDDCRESGFCPPVFLRVSPAAGFFLAVSAGEVGALTFLPATGLAGGGGGGGGGTGFFAPRLGNRFFDSESTSITMFRKSALNGDA